MCIVSCRRGLMAGCLSFSLILDGSAVLTLVSEQSSRSLCRVVHSSDRQIPLLQLSRGVRVIFGPTQSARHCDGEPSEAGARNAASSAGCAPLDRVLSGA